MKLSQIRRPPCSLTPHNHFIIHPLTNFLYVVSRFKKPYLKPGDGPIVLVLAPTRELAVQIKEECDKFGASSEIKNTVVSLLHRDHHLSTSVPPHSFSHTFRLFPSPNNRFMAEFPRENKLDHCARV